MSVKLLTEHHLEFLSLKGGCIEKPCLQGFAKTKVQTSLHGSRSLISTFVIRFLESITSRLAAGVISFFLLVSVAKETGLNLTLAETLRTGFLSSRPIITSSACPGRSYNSFFIFRSQTLSVESELPLHNSRLSADQEIWYTRLTWPRNVARNLQRK